MLISIDISIRERKVLGLPAIEGNGGAGYQFGPIQLWIDQVPGISQAEMWLQVCTSDTDKAAEYLDQEGVVRCDDIEKLSPDFDGFWIFSPASIIHLVCDQSHDH